MLHREFNLMLKALVENKKTLKKFYNNKYFSYSKDKSFSGSAAVVDNKSIVAFLQDANDEVIAMANFQNGPTIIYELSKDGFSHHKFSNNAPTTEDIGGFYAPKMHSIDRERIISEIASIREYCEHAKESCPTSLYQSIASRLSSIFKSSSQNLSEQEVMSLLQNMLDKLNEHTRSKGRNTVSPKVDVSSIPVSDSSERSTSQNLGSNDKIH